MTKSKFESAKPKGGNSMDIDLEDLPGDPNKAAIVAMNEATSIEEGRATAESQAGFVVAKRFPRDNARALNRVLDTCRRKSLAEQAEYAFPKGGQMVTGPSIRLAEAIAQNWGNIQFGIRELAEVDGASMLMAYCYDLETNTRAERIFTVKHVRTAKGKTTRLTDARDIYEINFNQGARRLRACILQVIPGDVVELAAEACRATLEATDADTTPENINKMLDAFSKLEVTKEMIEGRLGKKVSAIRPAEMVALRKIYTSLEDGMSKVDQWFSAAAAAEVLRTSLDKAVSEQTRAAAQKLEELKAKKEEEKAKTPPKKAAARPQDAPKAKTAPEPPEPPPGDPEPPEPASGGPAEEPEPEATPEATPEAESEPGPPDEPSGGPEETSYVNFAASTLDVGPKPSQWNAQVNGLRNRALATGVSEQDWHEAVMSILDEMGYSNINDVALSKRQGLKSALVVLVESLEEPADDE
jgi:hypothetical protein